MRRDEEYKKTSLKIPKLLLREARIRAIDDETDLQSVVWSALEAYLGVKKKGGKGGHRGQGK